MDKRVADVANLLNEKGLCGSWNNRVTLAEEILSLYKARYLGMLPKEIEIPTDVCGVKVTIAEAYGFNSAIQEMKRRMNER